MKKQRKKELNQMKEERNKILEIRKKENKISKNDEKNLLILSNKNNLDSKKTQYQNSLNDKNLMKTIIKQAENTRMNKNNYNHERIKQMHNEYETNKMKQKLEKENILNEKYKKNIKNLKHNNKYLIEELNKLEN